ncbi:DinB family protein [Longimicrobium sp.]|uniref:DinB family protein n=1 Tax=Longimicrobium sp. TaxID=2029185 RepID=UPI002E2FA3B3|nr:DinB family protein [Longimicrobium sp.]HEX6040366.1 DinB family protein [Longimicrobium sp.]
MIPRPDASEHLPYYAKYIDRVPDGDLLQTLRTQLDDTLSLVRGLDESRGGHRYAPGKWTIREVLAHVIDAERIFAYRALRIARGDATPLSSFDENAYAENAGAESRTLADLADELQHVRLGNLAMFRALSDDAFARTGTASGGPVSARALAWIIAGHELHHVALLRERYLADAPATAAAV